MCAPVLPNTSHPLGRPPLDQAVQPLPWNDCYVSPLLLVAALSLSRTILQWRDLSERLAPPQQQASPPPRKVSCADSHGDEDSKCGIHESWNLTREMERATRLEDLPDKFEELEDELMDLAVVQTSFDVTELDQVTDPAEFLAELKAFETLKDELVAGQRRRKIENARRIDDEHFAKLD